MGKNATKLSCQFIASINGCRLARYPQKQYAHMSSARLLLFIAILRQLATLAHTQSIPYGNNPATGHYFKCR